MSQNQAILKHLKRGWKLTPLRALEKFGCMRLGARILDLKREGYEIESKKKKVGKKYVAEYRIVCQN